MADDTGLPAENSAWPPPQMSAIWATMAEWSAWYSGRPEDLEAVYLRNEAREEPGHRRRRGLVGQFHRLFWGEGNVNLSQTRGIRLHIPIAGDIATAAAGLLYAEPPTLASANEDALKWFADFALETNYFATQSNATANGAMLSGHYLRPAFDVRVPGGAFSTFVDADLVWPQFVHGRLIAANICYTLESSEAKNAGSNLVYRQIQRHDTDPDTGRAREINALYQGTGDNLGKVVPLTVHPATAALQPLAEQFGGMVAGFLYPFDGIALDYVPNDDQQRIWRTHPHGRDLGRPDIDGVESQMDALDRVFTSIVRETDVAKARIFLAKYMLQRGLPGEGAGFDNSQDVFTDQPLTPINVPPNVSGGLPITMTNFPIRAAEHFQIIDNLVQSILRSCGYSARQFGEDDGGEPLTATGEVARGARSRTTRAGKISLARMPQRRHIEKIMRFNAMLKLDAAERLIALPPTYARSLAAVPTEVPNDLAMNWPVVDEQSELARAQTIASLRTAGALSQWWAILKANPNTPKEDLLKEYERILAEAPAVPEPGDGSFGSDDPVTGGGTPPDPENPPAAPNPDRPGDQLPADA